MNEPRSSPTFSMMLFCFAALGFVWSIEACVRVMLRVLGL
jgi:hypothetical protein